MNFFLKFGLANMEVIFLYQQTLSKTFKVLKIFENFEKTAEVE